MTFRMTFGSLAGAAVSAALVVSAPAPVMAQDAADLAGAAASVSTVRANMMALPLRSPVAATLTTAFNLLDGAVATVADASAALESGTSGTAQQSRAAAQRVVAAAHACAAQGAALAALVNGITVGSALAEPDLANLAAIEANRAAVLRSLGFTRRGSWRDYLYLPDATGASAWPMADASTSTTSPERTAHTSATPLLLEARVTSQPCASRSATTLRSNADPLREVFTADRACP